MSLYHVTEGRGLMAPGTNRERKSRRWTPGTEEGTGSRGAVSGVGREGSQHRGLGSWASGPPAASSWLCSLTAALLGTSQGHSLGTRGLQLHLGLKHGLSLAPA